MQIGALGRGQVIQRSSTRTPITETATTRYMASRRREQATTVLTRLQESLSRIDETARTRGRRSSLITDPTARSSQALGLTATATATTLRSTGELNTVTTSFSETNPAWTGGSTAAVTLAGVYDGSQGTDTLHFTVRRTGNGHRLRVFDSGGTRHDNILIGSGDPPGTVYGLSNNMTFSLGPGSLANNDEFWIDVDDDDPQAPQIDRAFDGSGGPVNLEPGVSVGAGTFDVNGTTITVDADDSISSVLAKITAFSDVDASYDAIADGVVLTQRVFGPTPTITIGNDLSGFVSAMNLSAAVPVPGTEGGEEIQPLQATAAFAGVVAGDVTINGTAVSVDPAVDTLLDVLDRMEATVPGLSAGYVLSSDRVVIKGSGSRLEIADATGLLDALYIDEGTFQQRVRSGSGLRRADRNTIGIEIGNVARDLNKLLELNQLQSGLVGGFIDQARELLQAAEDRDELALLGLRSSSRTALVDFSSTGARRLDRGLSQDPDTVLGLLQGRGPGESGLLAQLAANVEAAISINARGF